MCTPQQQTIRRNYACSIDETAYMQARLAGKYLVVYKDVEPKVDSRSRSEQAEAIDDRSLSGQSEEVVLSPSRSGQELQVSSPGPGIQLETGSISKHYFSFPKPLFHKNIGVGYLVYPLITEIVRCRGSPESYGLTPTLSKGNGDCTQLF